MSIIRILKYVLISTKERVYLEFGLSNVYGCARFAEMAAEPRYTGWQVKHGCVFGTLYKVTCQVYTCTVAYTGQVTFYKALEKHGYVKSVTLYILERLGKYSLDKIKLFSFNVVLHYESLFIKK